MHDIRPIARHVDSITKPPVADKTCHYTIITLQYLPVAYMITLYFYRLFAAVKPLRVV